MSANELEALLESEGVGAEGADDLLAWAKERAAALIEGLEEDGQLGPLLAAGGQPGAAPEPAANATPAAELEEAIAARSGGMDQDVTQPRAQLPTQPAPLPPIPTSATTGDDGDDDVEEIEEFEELDADELELLDDDDDDDDAADGAAPPMPALANGPVGPDGLPIDESIPPAPESSPSTPEDAPPAPDEVGTAAATDEGAPAEADSEGPRFGPPDGTDAVPAWRAALFSAQTGDDGLAAQKVREESTVGRLPKADDQAGGTPARAGRLVAEEDEISQHSIDLSDLDGDDGGESDARAGTGLASVTVDDEVGSDEGEAGQPTDEARDAEDEARDAEDEARDAEDEERDGD